jgi:hypothetical protein
MRKCNLLLLSLGLISANGVYAATSYSLTKLNLSGEQGIATDINNGGAVVGVTYREIGNGMQCSEAKIAPFLLKGNNLTSIATSTRSQCLKNGQIDIDISNLDVVIGTLNSRAFRYDTGELYDIHTEVESSFGMNLTSSRAIAINGNRSIAGSGQTENSCAPDAATTDGGNVWTIIQQGDCGLNWPHAVAINDSGDALVSISSRYGSHFSKLWKNSEGALGPVPGVNEMGGNGFPSHYAIDINNAGHIVGISQGNPYFWNGTTLVQLGSFIAPGGATHSVSPTALSNNDVIVGIAYEPTTNNTRGVVYEDGKWVDLNTKTSGAWIDTAEDVNDSGVIVGRYYDGMFGGYKLTPGGGGGGSDIKRTVIFIYGTTNPGQDMFIRGGLDWGQAKALMGKDCGAAPVDVNKWLCAIPMTHNGKFANETSRANDKFLDWYGAELNQGNVQGSPLVWTTNAWPANWGAKKTVANDGYGEDPQNTWGHHYWKLDVQMDCSKTYNGWFELKSFISNGPGWENNIAQAATPYPSINHFGRCGKLNKFIRNNNSVEIKDL